jgi:hypothetical protein
MAVRFLYETALGAYEGVTTAQSLSSKENRRPFLADGRRTSLDDKVEWATSRSTVEGLFEKGLSFDSSDSIEFSRRRKQKLRVMF